MADLTPSLTRAREQKITELSTHFANDDLTLEDLERRIEQVYKAVNIAELDSITADLVNASAASPGRLESRPTRSASGVPAGPVRDSGRILSIMG